MTGLQELGGQPTQNKQRTYFAHHYRLQLSSLPAPRVNTAKNVVARRVVVHSGTGGRRGASAQQVVSAAAWLLTQQHRLLGVVPGAPHLVSHGPKKKKM